MHIHFQVRPRGIGPAWWPVDRVRIGQPIEYRWVYATDNADWSVKPCEPMAHLDVPRAIDAWYETHEEEWPWEFQALMAATPPPKVKKPARKRPGLPRAKTVRGKRAAKR